MNILLLFSVGLAGFVLGSVLIGALVSMRAQARREQQVREAEQAVQGRLEGLVRVAEGRGHELGATVAELRRQGDDARHQLDATRVLLQAESAARAAADARVEETGRAVEKQQQLLVEAQSRLGDAFKSLAAEALSRNNDNFLTLAAERMQAVQERSTQDLAHRQREIEAVVKPVSETLIKVDEKIAELERMRGQAYGALNERVEGLLRTQHRLETETSNLVRALRAPAVRGRWGEIQLKRVVEMAGMVEYCDFEQQVTLAGDEGSFRPDMVVRLPGGRQVVVDAKVPLEAYLNAVETDDEDIAQQRLVAHAAQVKAHIDKLSAKSYWEKLSGSPEFVVLFLPGESLYSAALEVSPSLIEWGVSRRVLVATPTTLIALLQTIHLGWREERLAENAQKISEQGRALHKNLVTFSEHWVSLGKAIGRVNEQYNAAVGSLERRVLPSARRLEEMGAGSQKDLPEQLTLATRPRLVAALEGGGRGAGPARERDDVETEGVEPDGVEPEGVESDEFIAGDLASGQAPR